MPILDWLLCGWKELISLFQPTSSSTRDQSDLAGVSQIQSCLHADLPTLNGSVHLFPKNLWSWWWWRLKAFIFWMVWHSLVNHQPLWTSQNKPLLVTWKSEQTKVEADNFLYFNSSFCSKYTKRNDNFHLGWFEPGFLSTHAATRLFTGFTRQWRLIDGTKAARQLLWMQPVGGAWIKRKVETEVKRMQTGPNDGAPVTSYSTDVSSDVT